MGTNYNAGQTIYLTTSLTLYAIWKPMGSPPLYVIYDPNGGIGNINVEQVTANTYYYIRDQGYKHPLPNCTFKGWNTMPNATGINYSNNALVRLASNLILYAKW
jgi:hypothetical protein